MNGEPLLLTVEESARLLSIGRTKLYELMATGEIGGVVKIGRSVRISRTAVEEWVAARLAEAARDERAVV